jgi:hypothetical protein
VGRINRFAVPLTLERHNDVNEWTGSPYDDPEEILGVYDPVFSDLGTDNPERRTGQVLTETVVRLRDRITGPDGTPEEDGQVVTQVVPRYPRGEPVYYEVTL